MITIRQAQKQAVSQRQVFSQTQIQALRFLSIGAGELKTEIEKEADENPALEIVAEKKIKKPKRNFFLPFDDTKERFTNAQSEEKANQFQRAFENAIDTNETLQEHLLSELRLQKFSADENELAELLIRNLDENGYHVVSPISLLDKNKKNHTRSFLQKIISTIQTFEPEGCCVANLEESLYVQAKQKENANELSLFILNGNLSLLYSTSANVDFENVTKKINEVRAKKKLQSVSESDVRDAIQFISKLNPKPASAFGFAKTQYVKADVIIEKVLIGENENENASEKKIVNVNEQFAFYISLAAGTLPNVRVKELDAQKKIGKRKINRANKILEMIEYRKKILLDATEKIVAINKNFFLHNGEFIREPLTEKEMATFLEVHESTVSRMINNKFLQSPWGSLFPMKFFFAKKSEKIISLVQNVIDAHKDEKLSDQKIANELNKSGFHIARRTVAKYRKELEQI